MYAIWLLFNKTDTEYLKKIIKKMGDELNAPNFIPHITVYGILDLDIKIIKKTIQESVEEIEPFLVKKSSIKESDDLWKTIFIDVKANPELIIINNKLKLKFAKLSKYKFLPHVSLLYKKMGKRDRDLVIKKLKIKNEFRIDKIAVLKFSNNVNEWKIIEMIKF